MSLAAAVQRLLKQPTMNELEHLYNVRPVYRALLQDVIDAFGEQPMSVEEALIAASDAQIFAECGRRRNALRKNITRAGGRGPVSTPCPKCGEVQPSYREARAHCRNQEKTT